MSLLDPVGSCQAPTASVPAAPPELTDHKQHQLEILEAVGNQELFLSGCIAWFEHILCLRFHLFDRREFSICLIWHRQRNTCQCNIKF